MDARSKNAADGSAKPFRCAELEKAEPGPDGPRLGFSRAYSLTFSPQLIYTRSNLIPALVSSKIYRQVDFLAVGSWYCYYGGNTEAGGKDTSGIQKDGERVPRIHKIPGGREDVFTDKSINLRSARSIMKFLKVASDPSTHPDMLAEWGEKPFSECLSSSFKISPGLQQPLIALTLSLDSPDAITTSLAVDRIHRHLTSIGMFGPGFGAVIPKWGGLAEIAQVACRAGAVGGGVYVLKRGIMKMDDSGLKDNTLKVTLDDDEEIRARTVAGTLENFPHYDNCQEISESRDHIDRSVTIVSSPLAQLFPHPVEGAPPPASAVVVFPAGTLDTSSASITTNHQTPVYLSVHSSDTGECPADQCTYEFHIHLLQLLGLGSGCGEQTYVNDDQNLEYLSTLSAISLTRTIL